MGDVLILSRRGAGGVEQLAELVAGLGHRPVLVSERPADPNGAACAAHVVVDWAAATLEQAVTELKTEAVAPVGVLNMVESLIAWQADLARHYGLPGGTDGRAMLCDKASVRAEVRRLGRSDVRFVSGTAAGFPVAEVTRYPVIVKPAVESGASRLVARADDEAGLRARLRTLADVEGPGFAVIVEDFLDGTEFSIDGPVVAGRFAGLFAVEKSEHDDLRHHDAGLLVAPPQSDAVRGAVPALIEVVDALCARLRLAGMWLHVEGRALAGGRAELLEVNARPGGRLYRAAILHACGVDPFWEFVLMSLDAGYVTDCAGITQGPQLFGMLPFAVNETGRVAEATSMSVWSGIDGVVLGYALDGLEVTTLERENFYGELLLTAPDFAALRRTADRARAAFRLRVLRPQT